MDIGFIGTGNVGKALAQLFVHAGHHVVMSHRHSVESLSPLIEKLGGQRQCGHYRGSDETGPGRLGSAVLRGAGTAGAFPE